MQICKASVLSTLKRRSSIQRSSPSSPQRFRQGPARLSSPPRLLLAPPLQSDLGGGVRSPRLEDSVAWALLFV